MPTIEQNLRMWDASYNWMNHGNEWSSAWGGADAQWLGTLLPRISRHLPADTILEIAPGYGRWTNYLRQNCKQLQVVDLARNCIEFCRKRFAEDKHISYFVNDGLSLEMIPDESVDFVFSFDSLVHAESDVIESYLQQLARKLKPNGLGFFHHSNIGEYRASIAIASRLNQRLRGRLEALGILDCDHWRATTMSAKLFRNYCSDSGLQCVSQELVNWVSTRRLIDCLSTFMRPSGKVNLDVKVIRNSSFTLEAELVRKRNELYGVSIPGCE